MSNLIGHQRECLNNKNAACHKCNKQFSRTDSLKRHIRGCKGLTCEKCPQRFSSDRGLKLHQRTHFVGNGDADANRPQFRKRPHPADNPQPSTSKISKDGESPQPANQPANAEIEGSHPRTVQSTIRCATCGLGCMDRRELYKHRQVQHGRGDTLHNAPWGDDEAPWLGPDGSVEDEEFLDVFQTNRGHILRNHSQGEIRVVIRLGSCSSFEWWWWLSGCLVRGV